MKIVDKKMIFINSSERDSGTINDFTITLPTHLLTRKDNQKMRIILNDLVLPYTWYNVQSSNRIFTVTEQLAGYNNLSYQVILTPGSYHVLQLRDHLKQQLDFFSSVGGFHYIYTITYDEVSAKFKFTAAEANGASTTVYFIFDGYPTCKLLGFEPNSTNTFNSAVDDPGTNVTSTRAVNMMFTDALYMHCDLPTTNINKGSGDKSTYQVSNAFAKVPVNTSPFSNILYANVNDDFLTNIPERFINRIRFKFYTMEHNDIELNDDYSFTLKLEILEDDERTLVNQNTAIGELLRTLLLQQHMIKK
eukprot:SAG11_NODE_1978_length_3972_cov_45.154144_2_plen_305_part_00